RDQRPRRRLGPRDRRRGARRGRLPAHRRRDRRHRAFPAPPEPRRGVLHPDRAQRQRRRPRGGHRMSALALTTTPTRSKSPLRMIRHSWVLAKRNLVGVLRNPEALIDVTLQPIIFIAMFTYIFGGAIAHGSTHDYLQFLLPGILAQTIAFGSVAIGVNLNN